MATACISIDARSLQIQRFIQSSRQDGQLGNRTLKHLFAAQLAQDGHENNDNFY